ncbi:FAD-dependent oxidoreductase [Aurantiacibacter hainanensis]|uniref:FAD-dependent oxidoreductase n=1 Tax=Aurantiacibacter hainanensis TaxID=3076114 RepID=UPI0030C76322
MRRLEIAIVGCGMSGLAAALLLHGQGHDVTLYERFEAPRPVGSGLMVQPTGLAVLAALGLAERAVAKGAPVDALLGLNTEGEPVLEAEYRHLAIPGAFGLGIHRADLFGVLYEAVQAAGIAIATGHEVVDSLLEGEKRRLVFRDGEHSPSHDLVIDAAGLGSRLVPKPAAYLPFGALWATIAWPGSGPFRPGCLEQRYASARQMVGLLPVGEGRAAFFWSLKADHHEAWQDRSLAPWRDEVCTLWPECAHLIDQFTDPAQLTFARYAHRTTSQPVGERIVHIGDAWHAASPQLGQGANMALLDAFGLARAIAHAEELGPALAHFLKLRASHVRLYQWMTWWFTPPFQSDSPWPAIFRDLFMAPGSRIPPMPRVKAATLSGLAGSPLKKLGLSAPDYESLAAASPERASRICARASSLSQS